MIWITGMALAVVFVKLGMLIITVKLLSIGLGLMMAIGALLTLALFWKKGMVTIRRLFSTSTTSV